MASAARVHAAERGVEPEKLALVVTGGGGPLHGAEVARKLGIGTMVCPPAAGVASAIGLCLAPLRMDRSVFLGQALAQLTGAKIEAAFTELEAGITLNAPPQQGDFTIRRSADMRYIGQGFEIEVALPKGPYGDTHQILEAFRAAYERIFARTIDWAEVEIVALRLVATLPLVDDQSPLTLSEAKLVTHTSTQDIISSLGSTLTAKRLVWRESQAEIEGPALVAQSGSTLVLGPRDIAKSSIMGIGIINLESEAARAGDFDSVTTAVWWTKHPPRLCAAHFPPSSVNLTTFRW
jgi:N-methylhydantoinase A/oxoprolinase/acetone carboxylase beta subunit